MRDLDGADGVDRHGQHVVGVRQPRLTSELTARCPQYTQDLGAVETLTFTVLTKTPWLILLLGRVRTPLLACIPT